MKQMKFSFLSYFESQAIIAQSNNRGNMLYSFSYELLPHGGEGDIRTLGGVSTTALPHNCKFASVGDDPVAQWIERQIADRYGILSDSSPTD